MAHDTNSHIEDIETWASEHPGQGVPAARGYRIRLGDDGEFDEKTVIDDATPTARQILETAKRLPAVEYVLLMLRRDGMLDEINLDDTVDLRAPGVERFFVFRADRLFYFELDGRRFPWGSSAIGESLLRKLSGIPDNYNVWQERRGEEDLRLSVDAKADLSATGVERFYTGIDETQAGLKEGVLPQADRRYLKEHGIAFEEASDGNQKGVIFKAYHLPDHLVPEQADVLVLLPSGYPDAPTDSFYAIPIINRKAGGLAPNTNGNADFFGKKWQFWSRHNKEWRPGVDGIRTVLQRIDAALRAAQ